VIDRIAFNQSVISRSGSPGHLNSSISDYIPDVLTSAPSVSHEGWVQYDELLSHRLSTSPEPGPLPMIPDSVHVSEGYAVDLGNNSRVQISLYFLIVVICFNFLKLAIMSGILIADRANYIVTVGDAAASFLERPDPMTEGKCTLQKEEIMASYKSTETTASTNHSGPKTHAKNNAKTWQRETRRYCSSIGLEKVWSAILS
jgi:hypothetical protein